MIRFICVLFLVLAVAAPCLGQQSLVGAYRMVSNILTIDGTLIENMGKVPNGYLVFTPTRVVFFFTGEARKFGTTEADKASLFETLSAWAGTYRLEGNKIIVKVDASWTENWNGMEQVRTWELSGNRLTLTADPQPFPRDPTKTAVSKQVWEKVE
jgi:hypothetical protein